MLWFRYGPSWDKVLTRFTVMGARAANPAPILKRWGGYLRKAALARADSGEGWAPLAESTRKRLEQTRTARVTAHAQVRASYGRALQGYLQRQQRAGEPTAAADLAELHRLRAGGRVDRQVTKRGKLSSRAQAWAGGKAIGRLRAQLARAQAQAEQQRAAGQTRVRVSVGGERRKSASHKLLGRVARQVIFRAGDTSVKVLSKVPWSGVHNDGGTAGHGARIPKRVFLEITSENEKVMREIVLEHLQGRS